MVEGPCTRLRANNFIMFMLLLAGSLLPWMFHLIYVMGAAPDGVDIAPFGIAATGVTFAIATLRHRILNIQPLARDLVLDGIAEGVVVLDSKLRIIDFNRAATMSASNGA